MRFSIAFLLLGVSAVVSSLPIAHSTSSLELKGRDGIDVSDMFERDFNEPATVVMYPRATDSESLGYQVALHRSNAGTDHEHWSVRFHPENKAEVARWHVVDALSNKRNNGVLVTKHEERGGRRDPINTGYDPARNDENHHILGSYKDHASAKAAAESLTGLKCTKPYPDHNCVDWTKQAVDHLHAQGHINEDKHKQFTDLYNTHQAEVRKKTNTDDNRKHAGVPEKPVLVKPVKGNLLGRLSNVFKFGKKKV